MKKVVVAIEETELSDTVIIVRSNPFGGVEAQVQDDAGGEWVPASDDPRWRG